MITTKLHTTAAAHLGRQITGSAVAIVAITLILATAIVGVARQPAAPAVPTPALGREPVILIQKEREIQIKYVVATATPEPVSAPAAPLAPVPAVVPQAEGRPWHADPLIKQSGDTSTSTFDPPATATRYCKTFGGDAADWRNFDSMYSASPACEH